MPSDQDINDVLNLCMDAIDNGSKYSGMTYEQGVEAALRWVQNDGGNPMED